MQKEDPAAGPKLGVWVGSCLIPGEHSQNGKMVILEIGTVSGDALGLSGRDILLSLLP